jgi:hypothetical protein
LHEENLLPSTPDLHSALNNNPTISITDAIEKTPEQAKEE